MRRNEKVNKMIQDKQTKWKRKKRKEQNTKTGDESKKKTKYIEKGKLRI